VFGSPPPTKTKKREEKWEEKRKSKQLIPTLRKQTEREDKVVEMGKLDKKTCTGFLFSAEPEKGGRM